MKENWNTYRDSLHARMNYYARQSPDVMRGLDRI